MTPNFWETKTLFEMSSDEWEAICDGCAKCCLVQLQDEDSEQLVFTDVACDLLDDKSCRCTDYKNRSERVPSCMSMNKENVVACAEFSPPSCSYRLILEGKPLPQWHHLITGTDQSIHKEQQSVKNRVRFQRDIKNEELENFVVNWPNVF